MLLKIIQNASTQLYKQRVLIFCLCVLVPWSNGIYYSHTHRKADHMSRTDKMSMVNISEEAVKEAQLKLRQLSDIRDEHSHKTAFDVGLIMGNIRERYRRMLETYRQYRDKVSNRSRFYPPGIASYFMPIYFLMAMENVHAIELDIDKLIHVLEIMDNEDLNPDPRYIGRQSTRPRRQMLRVRDYEIIGRMAEEQELKSRSREAHLMRRLGMSQWRHTTAKRFQHQWPVDKNWDFGQYDDMGIYV